MHKIHNTCNYELNIVYTIFNMTVLLLIMKLVSKNFKISLTSVLLLLLQVGYIDYQRTCYLIIY